MDAVKQGLLYGVIAGCSVASFVAVISVMYLTIQLIDRISGGDNFEHDRSKPE